MPLLYDAGTWYDDGEAVTLRELIAMRDLQIGTWAAELRTLFSQELGPGVVPLVTPPASLSLDLWHRHEVFTLWSPSSVTRFANQFLTKIADMITKTYVYASG